MKKCTIFILFLITSLRFSQALGQGTEAIAGWVNWFGANVLADQGSSLNINTSILSTTGGTDAIVTSDADGTGQRAFATGWAGGANTKAWKIQLVTSKFTTLKFSCRMSGTGSLGSFLGPRDFKLQYSLNNIAWTDVSGGTLVAGNGTSAFTSLTNVVLPAACENLPALYLRMLMTSNVAVNGGTVNGGQSHIDDIVVSAVSIPEAPTDITLTNGILLIPVRGGATGTGTAIGNMSSTDFNIGNTFNYTLVAGTGSTNNNLFAISTNSLSTASSLVAGTYSIRVRTTDNTGFIYEEAFTIKVIEPSAISQGVRQRISTMGTNGSALQTASVPINISYNSTNNEYLSVWWGDDNTSPLVDNEFEIFGQRINGATGVSSGNRIRISAMGTNGVPNLHRGLNPSVTYNATNNEYLVVWQGDHNTGALNNGEDEIWGQRINALTGDLAGSMIRISTMGTDGNVNIDAQFPDVSWSAADNQYLVVWRADDNTSPIIDNENEIYGQRVANTGTLSGARLRISTMGPDGSALFNATTPAITYNAVNNLFMVVWQGDDNTSPLIDNEMEIFSQAVTNMGVLSGSRIRVSAMGPNGSTLYAAASPDITWNSNSNNYFIVWSADDNSGSLIDNENEIYGQSVSNTGVLSGSRIRLSNMGTEGSAIFNAGNPKLCYNQLLDEYWVVWQGDDNNTSVDNEVEIFLQRVTSQGVEAGTNDTRISYMGPMGDAIYDAAQPAIAYNSTDSEAFVVWQGDDNTSPLIDNEYEIYGQSLSSEAVLPVTWLSFTAEILNNQTVGLNWQTASETNSKAFIIQRGVSTGDWTNIGNLAAAVNSNTIRDYHYIDPKPFQGLNYYRLIQKDIDGASSFSKVVLVNFSKVEFAIFPNPVADYLTVQLHGSGPSTMKLFDNAGRLVHQQQYQSNNVVLDVRHISPGIYHMQIFRNKVMLSGKFVKN